MASDALRAVTGMHLGEGEDAMDACVFAYAKLVLPTFGVDVDGVWWRETYDPVSLSAPRGCIFPDKVARWDVVVADQEDDVERLLEMPATTWVQIGASVPVPGRP